MKLRNSNYRRLLGKTFGVSFLTVFLTGCLSGGGGSSSGASSATPSPDAACIAPVENSSDPLIASTCQGTFAGENEGDMRAFKGIRYGEAERFSAPAFPPAHEETLQLSGFGDSCAQPDTTFGKPSDNEDCLYLNVYSPDKPGDYPVMVWIHGGALLG